MAEDQREIERERRRAKLARQYAKRRGHAKRQARAKREQRQAFELDRMMGDYARAFQLAVPLILLLGVAFSA